MFNFFREVWKNLHLYTHTGAQHNFHIRLCSCRLTVARVLVVEDERLILREQMVHACFFSGVSVAQSLVFCVAWCGPLSVHSSFYVVTIVLLSELRLMITSFGIFNISWMHYLAAGEIASKFSFLHQYVSWIWQKIIFNTA